MTMSDQGEDEDGVTSMQYYMQYDGSLAWLKHDCIHILLYESRVFYSTISPFFSGMHFYTENFQLSVKML